MKKEKFFGKFKNMNIDQTELNRKYAAYLREQELMMMYEAAAQSSSSAAASAGGGGSIGANADYRAESWLFTTVDENGYICLQSINFTTGKASATVNTGLLDNGDTSRLSLYIGQNAGYMAIYYSTSTSTHTCFFLTADAGIAQKIVTAGGADWGNGNSQAGMFYFVDYDDNTINIFNGSYSNSYTFSNIDEFDYNGFTKNGSFMFFIYDGSNWTSYLGCYNGQLLNLDTIFPDGPTWGNWNADFITYLDFTNSNFATKIVILKDNGSIVLEQDISEYEIWDWDNTANYGSNNFWLMGYDDDTLPTPLWTMINYDGDNGKLDIATEEKSRDYDDAGYFWTLWPSNGYNTFTTGDTVSIYFYSFVGNDLWNEYDYYNIVWAGKGSNGFHKHLLTDGDTYQINWIGNDGPMNAGTPALPYFLNGDTYVSMGLLTKAGWVSTETDVEVSTITNTLGYMMGEKTLWVFNIDTVDPLNRTWLITGDTLEHTLYTTADWALNDIGINYGYPFFNTAVVKDTVDNDNSFVYSSGKGIQSLPSDINYARYNNVIYGTVTGINAGQYLLTYDDDSPLYAAWGLTPSTGLVEIKNVVQANTYTYGCGDSVMWYYWKNNKTLRWNISLFDLATGNNLVNTDSGFTTIPSATYYVGDRFIYNIYNQYIAPTRGGVISINMVSVDYDNANDTGY